MKYTGVEVWAVWTVVAVGVEVVVGAVVTVPGVVVDVVIVGATVCSNVIFLQYINVVEC